MLQRSHLISRGAAILSFQDISSEDKDGDSEKVRIATVLVKKNRERGGGGSDVFNK